jgi:uncharacterized repeat protein (TIGR03803 family)
MSSKQLCPGAKKAFIALLVILVAATSAWASHEKILHEFVNLPQGAYPEGKLIADAAGNLYGTTSEGGKFGYGAVFELARGKDGTWSESVLYSFTGGADGSIPIGGLVLDNAGNLYGTAAYGGTSGRQCNEPFYTGCGVVFELSPGTGGKWTENVLHSFAGYPNDGQSPLANLIFDAAGNLYGTTEGGGAYNRYSDGGTVFELTPESNGTWTENILYNFTGGADGATPSAALVFDSAGNLYSTTESGGNLNCTYNVPDGCGTVFRLAPNGGGTWSENVLHSFSYTDGANPLSNLVFDKKGNLYGDTPAGPGSACDGNGCGLVFRLTPNSDGTWTETIIYEFEGGSDGIEPVAGLILDAAGSLYGTTQLGGSDSCNQGFGMVGCGTAFELTQNSKGNWTENVIHRFSMPPHGENYGIYPVSGLSLDQAGNLYGTARDGGYLSCYDFIGCGTVFQLSPASDGRWNPSVLYAFNTGQLGANPVAGVISDSTGNLYGTAQDAGDANYGVAFELIPQSGGGWKEVVLHSFQGGSDGVNPSANLVFDAAGNLYGTTLTGGSQQCSEYYECGGTVYELSPTAQGWKESVLYRFGKDNDRSLGLSIPTSGLVLDSAGILYGTTFEGGDPNCDYGCGTAYKLFRSGGGQWQKELLHLFHGGNDGANPYGTLVLDGAGNLYGTACGGGSKGYGTVFKLSPDSGGKWIESVLYSFKGGMSDGSCPLAGVIFDRQGNLYGTTFQGGNTNCKAFGDGCGVVFELSPTETGPWMETVLLMFQGTDGSNPESTLTFDSDGNLYGCAAPRNGNYVSDGVVFELSRGVKGWTEHVLHRFGKGYDGSAPSGTLVLDSEGNIYGATNNGGTDGSGTVFELSPGLDGGVELVGGR